MRWRSVQEFVHLDRTMLVRRPDGDLDDGPAVVLVHGIGVSSRYWTRLAPLLAPHASVHVVELPGFGDAPRRDEVLSIEEHASTLLAHLRAEGLDSAVLVGHSMGVQVVVEAALQDPARVRAVVGIGGVVDPSSRSTLRQALKLGHDVLREPLSANKEVLRDYARTGLRWYLQTVPSMIGYRTEDALPRLEVPLLVVRGSRDPICTREWAEEMTALAPRARLVEIPGGAHVTMFSRPQEVADEVLAEVRATAAAPPAAVLPAVSPEAVLPAVPPS